MEVRLLKVQLMKLLGHSITKLSFFHFVSTIHNKKRVLQLGENPKNVNNCGSLGVETPLITKFLKKDTLIRDLKINFNKNLILTFHPETFESKKTNIKFAKIIIEALRLMKDINFFITSSNIDRYGEEINKIFYNASKKYGNFYFFESLGREKNIFLY